MRYNARAKHPEMIQSVNKLAHKQLDQEMENYRKRTETGARIEYMRWLMVEDPPEYERRRLEREARENRQREGDWEHVGEGDCWQRRKHQLAEGGL